MNNVSAVILAAGKGERMKSKHPKTLNKLFDKPMIQYIYESIKDSGIEEQIMVVGYKSQEIIDYMGNKVKYAFQQQQLGTGHAVMQAEEFISDYSEDTLVICGDTPLISHETINKLIDYHKKNEYSVTVLTTEIDEPEGYGRIVRDENGDVVKIINCVDANKTEKQIKEVNSGIMCFKTKNLFETLKEVDNNNKKGEYYLTSVLDILKDKGFKVGAMKIKDYTEVFGINTRQQLTEVQSVLLKKIVQKHIDQGVGIIDPHSTYISNDVQIGMDTIVYPGTIIEGKTTIGEDCIIGPNTTIINSNVSDKVTVSNSIIRNSNISQELVINPFSYIANQSK